MEYVPVETFEVTSFDKASLKTLSKNFIGKVGVNGATLDVVAVILYQLRPNFYSIGVENINGRRFYGSEVYRVPCIAHLSPNTFVMVEPI